jgi:hypothetical protein
MVLRYRSIRMSHFIKKRMRGSLVLFLYSDCSGQMVLHSSMLRLYNLHCNFGFLIVRNSYFLVCGGLNLHRCSYFFSILRTRKICAIQL